jgi:Metal-dependent hydrolases of the beta-lactamase superfamily I
VEQLQRTDTYRVDAFFLTHFHRDHADGLLELLQTLRSGIRTAWNDAGDGHAFDLYMSETATRHLRETFDYFLDLLDPTWDSTGVSVGGLAVRPFAVEHMRPEYATVGFVVTEGDHAVAYAPDMAGVATTPPTEDIDLLVCEGSPFVGRNHGPADELRASIERLDADRTFSSTPVSTHVTNTRGGWRRTQAQSVVSWGPISRATPWSRRPYRGVRVA